MTTPQAQEIPAATSAEPLIRLHNIHKAFGSLVVLSGLNLEVREGESLVVIGPSGTGKSVLLKHLVGLLKPDQGEVYFKGQRVDELSEAGWDPIRRNFGFLFQMGALFDSLSVHDNIAFPLREHATYTEARISEIVRDKLAMVGLESTRNKMPGDLSGGQKKRVALARAIALDPEVVLYDEPTTGLDPIRADVINELILKLREELKVTSIVVTHDMASAFKVGDRLVMLLDGKVIAEGTPDDIRNSKDDRVQRFVQGRASPEDLAALRRATEDDKRDTAGNAK
jgi:phospholipid/cholesterol/gamma-HCH transport system ATP-binding protein